MMPLLAAFILGSFVGSVMGLLTAALCVAAGQADEAQDRIMDRDTMDGDRLAGWAQSNGGMD